MNTRDCIADFLDYAAVHGENFTNAPTLRKLATATRDMAASDRVFVAYQKWINDTTPAELDKAAIAMADFIWSYTGSDDPVPFIAALVGSHRSPARPSTGEATSIAVIAERIRAQMMAEKKVA